MRDKSSSDAVAIAIIPPHRLSGKTPTLDAARNERSHQPRRPHFSRRIGISVGFVLWSAQGKLRWGDGFDPYQTRSTGWPSDTYPANCALLKHADRP